MSQTNTRTGDIPVAAGDDLTSMEDRLVKLANSSGSPVASLPAANGDLALFLVVEGAAAGKTATLRPLNPDRNVRALLKGTCNPGDTLVLADVGTAADKGKVRALPAAAGTYRGLLIAEEAGVDGQLVLARPATGIGNLTVT
jgi:hypothetical protein